MNPVFKILSSIIIKINNIIDSMSLKNIEAIKRGFYFFIFVMSVAGIIFGYNMGTKSAKIKSDPLAEFVNDTFKIDINKEKADGDFSQLLESEIINESPINNFNKTSFPIRENLNPEINKEAIESANKIPEPDVADKPLKPETPIDEKNNSIQNVENQSVKIVDKQFKENKTDGIIIKNIDEQKITPENKTREDKVKNKNIIDIIEKDKKVVPEPIKKDTGIINK